MKQWWKRIVVLLAVVCVLWGTAGNVMAEGTQIPSEIVEKYIGKPENKYYDVGGSIWNGVFEINSTSDSLKAGDTVEVQIICNTDNIGDAGGVLTSVIMSLYYDKDVLQYSDVIMNDDYGKSSFNLVTFSENSKDVTFIFKSPSGFDQNSCIATVQFKVKQETSAITIYCGEIDASSQSTDADYYYDDDMTDDGGYKVMSVTVNDTSVPAPTPEKGTFALSNGTVEGNGAISVPIAIQSNDGFAALGLTINYDATLFDYKALEVDSNLKDKIALKDIYPTDGQIKAAFVAGQNITDVGAFLNLTLETKESAPIGTTSDVTITVTQVANYDEESLNGTGAVCTVTLAENTSDPGYVLGDVNNDGSIDLVDALCVLQYYNSVKELTDDEKTAADVDKNKTVDLVDALRIMKFYNGEISGF